MNLSNLHPAEGSRKQDKRRGRGPGSGLGKTAGRGHKGQKSIAGYSRKKGFEGGQMPLHRRLPKRGFTNIFRTTYTEINLDQVARLAGQEIGPRELCAAGLIKKETERVKILGRGEISVSKKIQAHKFSRSAQEKIEKAGGQTVIIGNP
ncbi:MAG: 50S ribosomal protein L15 [Candidatus Aminicenantales bacterium]